MARIIFWVVHFKTVGCFTLSQLDKGPLISDEFDTVVVGILNDCETMETELIVIAVLFTVHFAFDA